MVGINSIKTWSQYVIDEKLPESNNPKYPVDEEINSKISLWMGTGGKTIVDLKVDAIVNAANEYLKNGGGICGAIHAAAGPSLEAECQKFPEDDDGIRCDPGSAKITRGYNLPAKYVIHAVGPRDKKGETLEKTYKSCLDLMLQYNIKTIAFPCISTVIFGFPNKIAIPHVAKVVREFLHKYKHKVDRIIFCMFTPQELQDYRRALPKFFPTNSRRLSSSGRSSGRVPTFVPTTPTRPSKRMPDLVPPILKRPSGRVSGFVTKTPERSSKRVYDFDPTRRVLDFVPTSPQYSSKRVIDNFSPARFRYYSSKVSGRSPRPSTTYSSSILSSSSTRMPDYVSTTSLAPNLASRSRAFRCPLCNSLIR